MQSLPSGGAMAAVFAEESVVSKAITAYTDQLSIAAMNGPSNVVISGAELALSQILQSLAGQGIKSRRLTVSHAFHSPLMEPILNEFENIASTIRFAEPQIGLMSNVTGKLATAHQVTQARYWRDHVRQPVRFADTMVNLNKMGCDVFIEIGPNPTLLSMGKQCLTENTYAWLPSLHEGQGDWQTILASLAQLYTMGVDIDWKNFDRDYPRQKLVLPTYPFQRERFWAKGNPAKQNTRQNIAAQESSVQEDVQDLFYKIQWFPQPRVAETTAHETKDNWLIFGDSDHVGEKLAASLRTIDHQYTLVKPAEKYTELSSDQVEINPTEPADFVRLLQKQTYDDIVYLWSLDNRLTEDTTVDELLNAQEWTTGGLLNLVQALINEGKSTLPRLWVTTREAQTLSEEPRPIEAGQTAILGLSRTLRLEYPELRCVCIDLPIQSIPNEVDALRTEILQSDPSEEEIALRESRYVRRLVKADVIDSSTAKFREDASYLITGGLRGVGLLVAEWMSQNGARNLVLMSRSGTSEEAKGALTRMQQSGVRTLIAKGDVSNPEDISKILTEVEQKMPPLRGVIHAAGVLDDGILLQQNWSRFEKVMAPKVRGSWNLHLMTEHLPLDFFVMFSSGAAILGSAGQSNYSAANAFMDGLAGYRRAQGLPAISIDWGAWAEVGMAAKRDLDKSRGIKMLRPKVGLQALATALLLNTTQLAVLPADWNSILSIYPIYEEPSLLREIARSSRPQEERSTTHHQENLVQQLIATVPNKRKSFLLDHIRGKAARVLAANNLDAIDPEQPLQSMGLDSLMAVELRNQLSQSVGQTLPATLLFEYPTIHELGDYLFHQVLKLDGEANSSTKSKTELEANLDSKITSSALDGLSSEELAALLKEKLGQINDD
jgi:acyl transferase domain-containing protein